MCWKFIILTILNIFGRSFSTLSDTLLLIHFTFSHSDKRILVSHLSCFCWRTLISSLFTAFVSSFHRFEIVFACLPWSFPLALVKMNFPLYYPLFLLHGHFCCFVSVCLLLYNAHSSFCLRALFIVFTHFLCHLLRFLLYYRDLALKLFYYVCTLHLFGSLFLIISLSCITHEHLYFSQKNLIN